MEPYEHDYFDRFRPVPPRRWLDRSRRPPRELVRALRSMHPKTGLAWEPQLDRWAVYEKVGMRWEIVGIVCDADRGFAHPTWDNTVNFLNRCTKRGIHNTYDLQRWLDGIDEREKTGKEEIRKRVEPQIREGSAELWDLMNGKVQVARP